MTYRLITFTLNELAHSPETIADTLTHACRRGPKALRVTGVCQTAHSVSFPCEATEGSAPRYVIAPLRGDATDELAADLHTRWVSGFTTVGMIRLPELQLGVFSHPKG